MPAADPFEATVLADGESLAALARRMLGDSEAEDALQEAWIRAWTRRAALADPGAQRAWMRRIVVRECLRVLRWRAVRRWLPFGAEVPELPAPEGPDPDLRHIRRVVEALSPQQRVVWGLRFDEGWTVPEIAASLALSPETVKTQLGRALQVVQARLEVTNV